MSPVEITKSNYYQYIFGKSGEKVGRKFCSVVLKISSNKKATPIFFHESQCGVWQIERNSLFMLRSAQFGWAKGETKNWEDQNIKIESLALENFKQQ